MMIRCLYKKKDPFVGWVLLGIPVFFIAATPLHFLFEWTGNNICVGLFAPVNESPWEHLKLTFWPILIWWILGYLFYGKKNENALPRFTVSCAVAEIVCSLFIIAFYYTYTGAFGIESLILDILSLLLGLILGLLLAIHIYSCSNPGKGAMFLSAVILLVMAGAFIIFTFMPPHIPLFKDPPSGTYGIQT
jgi:hypothetical protein